MLKVIQVKIQEHTSCKKKSSKTALFDQSKDRLNRIEIQVCRILSLAQQQFKPKKY